MLNEPLKAALQGAAPAEPADLPWCYDGPGRPTPVRHSRGPLWVFLERCGVPSATTKAAKDGLRLYVKQSVSGCLRSYLHRRLARRQIKSDAR
jgi:hypothetical protein